MRFSPTGCCLQSHKSHSALPLFIACGFLRGPPCSRVPVSKPLRVAPVKAGPQVQEPCGLWGPEAPCGSPTAGRTPVTWYVIFRRPWDRLRTPGGAGGVPAFPGLLWARKVRRLREGAGRWVVARGVRTPGKAGGPRPLLPTGRRPDLVPQSPPGTAAGRRRPAGRVQAGRLQAGADSAQVLGREAPRPVPAGSTSRRFWLISISRGGRGSRL